MKNSRSLRLLLFYDCVYPESLGGVEHRNHELAIALGDRGHDVTVAGFTTNPRQTGPKTRVISVGSPGRLYSASGRRSIREAIRLALAASRLDLSQYDVVETANIPYIHLFPLAFRCKLLGKPLLVTWHEYWGRYWKLYMGRLSWFPFAVVEWLATKVGTATTAVSQLTADRVSQRRRAQNIQVIPNGLSIEHVRSSARNAPSGPPLVYAGRLQREKRIDLLLRAIQRLDDRREEHLLTIIGDGPEKEHLENLAEELGLSSRLVFSGRLPANQDVWEVMGGAQVAVQPSYREGFGLFPLEAMALGLPVVYCSSPESAVSELVRSGQEGIGVEARPETLAAAIEVLLSDKAEYQRLSANARKRAQDFDWSEVTHHLEDLLNSLAGPH